MESVYVTVVSSAGILETGAVMINLPVIECH